MDTRKWDDMSLLRLEKSADAYLRLFTSMAFTFLSLFIFVPMVSIMRIYIEGDSSTIKDFADFLSRFSILKGFVFLILECAGLYLASLFQKRALKMYDYIDRRKNKLQKNITRGR